MNKSIHTYIHTYTQERKKEKNSDRTNIVIYNPERFIELQNFARKNNTNASSIINNLFEAFLNLFEENSPQKDLFNCGFLEAEKTPDIFSKSGDIINFCKNLPEEERKKLESKLYRLHIYLKALNSGEKNLTNYVYLWGKYK